MDWQDVKAIFEWDGSWLDIYVLKANPECWQKALDFVRASYPLVYGVDLDRAEFPREVTAIFSKRVEANTWLNIDVNGIDVACHFFTEDEIEFDLDPRHIDDETMFGHLCEFMRRLGQHLDQSVILTPENNQDRIIIQYLLPEDKFVYTPPLSQAEWKALLYQDGPAQGIVLPPEATSRETICGDDLR